MFCCNDHCNECRMPCPSEAECENCGRLLASVKSPVTSFGKVYCSVSCRFEGEKKQMDEGKVLGIIEDKTGEDPDDLPF